MTPVQRVCAVVDVAPAGAYTRLRLEAPDLGARAEPGHFVAFAVGGPSSALLLRRAVAVYRADDAGIDVVVAPHGAGTRWLADQAPGALLDVVGPLGRPFPDPTSAGPVVVVGGGYGSSALVGLVDRLRRVNRHVTAVLGAATADRLFGVEDMARLGCQVLISTDDGSRGTTGTVTDVLVGEARTALDAASAVYACGPMGMLAATAALAAGCGVPCWCSVEESMACGIGVCMTCVLPVVGDDGRTRMVRSCVAGPTFDGTAVRWADVGTVPPDCVGAPRPT
jgi:dihydroorotate dehydrogenase electron transfer subunit